MRNTMPTTTLLEPSDTLTLAPHVPSITVRDLMDMLAGEDPDACVHVAMRAPPETVEMVDGKTTRSVLVQESDEVDFQPTSGIERRWYGGRKVVVVR